MKKGTREFSIAASSAYSSKSEEEKAELRRRCSESTKNLTAKRIKQTGRRIFKTIDKQVSASTKYNYMYIVFVSIGPQPVPVFLVYREPMAPISPYW